MELPNWDLGGKYKLLKKLGQGTFGSVYSAKTLTTGELVAIKDLNGIFNEFLDARRMLREISVMRLLHHPCIIKIKEVIVSGQNFNILYIVMEYAESDLKKLIRSPVFLDHEQVKYLFYQALVGLRYTHSANILHRDLKPANILINSDCSLKICDFGLSRSVQEPKSHSDLEVIKEESDFMDVDVQKPLGRNTRKGKRMLSGHVVTRWYRAPELILLERNYDKQIDVWSLGCVFAEMLTMIRDNAPFYLERGPIFPGKSCFPLSPDVGNSAFKNGYPTSDTDQINIIMEILGTPDDQDLVQIGDNKAINYIKSFEKKEKRPFNMLFPGSTAEEIEILDRMLVFNRLKRITVDQLLEMPYFFSVRNPELEYLATIPANFEFDMAEEMSIDQMKEIFIKQLGS